MILTLANAAHPMTRFVCELCEAHGASLHFHPDYLSVRALAMVLLRDPMSFTPGKPVYRRDPKRPNDPPELLWVDGMSVTFRTTVSNITRTTMHIEVPDIDTADTIMMAIEMARSGGAYG